MITTVGNRIESAKRLAGQGLQSAGSAIGSATISVKNAAGDAFNGAKNLVMGSPTQNSPLRGAAKGATKGIKASATKTAATAAPTAGTAAITLREASTAAPAAKTAAGTGSLLTAKNAATAGTGIGAGAAALWTLYNINSNRDKHEKGASKEEKSTATLQAGLAGALATAAGVAQTGLKLAANFDPRIAAAAGALFGAASSNDVNLDTSHAEKSNGIKRTESVATALISGATSYGAMAGVGAATTALGLTGAAATAATIGTALVAPMALGAGIAWGVKGMSDWMRGRETTETPQPQDDSNS